MSSYSFDHTHLTTSEPDKVIAFYTEVMGAKTIEVRESNGRKITTVDLGGIPVRITSSTSVDSTWKGPKYGLHHLGLVVSNMDEFISDLQSRGVEILTEPKQSRPGVRTAFFIAPGDVLFEVQEIAES